MLWIPHLNIITATFFSPPKPIPLFCPVLSSLVPVSIPFPICNSPIQYYLNHLPKVGTPMSFFSSILVSFFHNIYKNCKQKPQRTETVYIFIIIILPVLNIVPEYRNTPNIFVKDHLSSFADSSEILKLLGSRYHHLTFKINIFLIQWARVCIIKLLIETNNFWVFTMWYWETSVLKNKFLSRYVGNRNVVKFSMTLLQRKLCQERVTRQVLFGYLIIPTAIMVKL